MTKIQFIPSFGTHSQMIPSWLPEANIPVLLLKL